MDFNCSAAVCGVLRPYCKTYNVYRKKSNIFGEADGEPQLVGSVYGYFYSKKSGLTIALGVPGHLLRTSETAILVPGYCPYLNVVTKGDLIRIGDTEYPIVTVRDNAGIARTIVLQEV